MARGVSTAWLTDPRAISLKPLFLEVANAKNGGSATTRSVSPDHGTRSPPSRRRLAHRLLAWMSRESQPRCLSDRQDPVVAREYPQGGVGPERRLSAEDDQVGAGRITGQDPGRVSVGDILDHVDPGILHPPQAVDSRSVSHCLAADVMSWPAAPGRSDPVGRISGKKPLPGVHGPQACIAECRLFGPEPDRRGLVEPEWPHNGRRTRATARRTARVHSNPAHRSLARGPFPEHAGCVPERRPQTRPPARSSPEALGCSLTGRSSCRHGGGAARRRPKVLPGSGRSELCPWPVGALG
jgi:hypothetical protein